jgi:hydroxyacylglutathione hydrolase
LTHYHYDHTNLADELSTAYNCPVFLNREEAETGYFECKNLFDLGSTSEIMTQTAKVTCLNVPGHSLGGTCYIIGNMVFTGDVLLNEGCGYPDYNEYLENLFSSIRFLRAQIKDNQVLCPGHSYGTKVGLTMKQVRKINIYLNLDKFEDFTGYLLRERNKTTKFT